MGLKSLGTPGACPRLPIAASRSALGQPSAACWHATKFYVGALILFNRLIISGKFILTDNNHNPAQVCSV